ncbi:MAG: dihydrolipoyl dehydrogenase [Acetobacteraceae bacterium]|nr:dihydrolipoyl dehydrogenase [Acetobacteraceae bacterium]
MSETSDAFDLVVIGAGPGGYVCAIRAAQLGMRVACAEERETLGGTCLNIGCIPSKALLQSSENYSRVQHALAKHGITVGDVTFDLSQMMKRKDEVVSANVKGIEYLFRKNGVTWLKGRARIAGQGLVDVAGKLYQAKHIVLATGSESTPLPGIEIDEKTIVTSTGALSLERVPKQLVVVGGGYIGLELGSVWSRLGAAVTVVELQERLLPTMDAELAKQAERILARQGLKFRLNTKVLASERTNEGVALRIAPGNGGPEEEIRAEVVLVAVGRRPFTNGLGLAEAGVRLNAGGRVETDDQFRTNVPGIYAIGDLIRGPMLAHKAEEEGVAVAEILAGQAGHVNYNAIPGVVYTWPEIASVGKTEEELKAEGVDYAVGKFPFSANSRARTMGDLDGFVKILAERGTDRILGAHIIGPDAGTLIAELALAVEFDAAAEDLARTPHAHPSLNEAVKEAALAVANRAIHI